MTMPTKSATSIACAFIAELDAEMPPTRRLLERARATRGRGSRIPSRSRSATWRSSSRAMPGWLTHHREARRSLDLSRQPRSTRIEHTETLLAEFDRCVKRGARRAWRRRRMDDLGRPVSR